MKITENWLREWIDPPLKARQLADQLTMAGLEVEAVEPCAIAFSGVTVARIESVQAHPKADNLQVCEVDDGNSRKTVVSATANLRDGMHVALAGVGARLAGDKQITAATIKGMASAGMLCSAQDLGLEESSTSILELPRDLRPGTDLASLFGGGDNVFGIAITPNRGDCLSLAGIAREISVLNDIALRVPLMNEIPPATNKRRKVHLDAAEDCPHYAGRIIENVDVTQPAPLWLTLRLQFCGIRSINAVVDITNYVMLELGQPMHAFADDCLEGGIHVRHSAKGETLTLLDGKDCTLDEGALVIADDHKALALAGVMGGQDSAVTTDSRTIFLESAWFAPAVIQGQARRFGLTTDSSYRFERGVDYTLQRQALERATQLICMICRGQPGPVVEESFPAHLPVSRQITLHDLDLKRLLGLNLEAGEVTRILRALGMEVMEEGENWLVVPPPWRTDLAITADLCEEIARIHGYHRIPDHAPQVSMQFHPPHDRSGQVEAISNTLVGRGYYEAITYSFVDNDLQDLITPDTSGLKLANPISSDLAVMRTSLWPGLLQALLYNVKRQQDRVRLFESGLVFVMENGDLQQLPMAGGVIYGNPYEKQLNRTNKLSDYFDVKGDVIAVLQTAGVRDEESQFKPSRHPALHPGLSADIYYKDQYIGCCGALHPGIQLTLDLSEQVYIFELNIDRISKKITPRYKQITKYPAVKRDLAILIPESVPAGYILQCIKKVVPDMLTNLELFDVYQGEGIDLGKKSVALGLTFQQSSRTLTDEEVEDSLKRIISRLEDELGGKLRE